MRLNERKSVCAGSWYPADKEELRMTIDELLAEYKSADIHPKAIIVPHAGYFYSGKTAAAAFSRISPSVKKIILLGTSHHYYLRGGCVLNYKVLLTPLGEVKVSNEMENFIREPDMSFVPEADKYEHSIEIELPFLQRVLKDFEVIPVIVGEINPISFSETLDKYSDDNTLIVVSVDLSHFHTQQEANKLDKFTIDTVLNLRTADVKKCEIDSPYAVAALIELAKKRKWKPSLLDYRTSADVTRDTLRVVGYSAIAFN